MPTVEIPIRDEFDNSVGQFRYYDCYDAAQLTQLLEQKHVDIRSFDPPSTAPITMSAMDLLGMNALDADTMAVLEGLSVVRTGESWTSGTVATQADRNHWNGISFPCVTGANSTSGTIAALPPATGLISVDISSFASTDFITVALPAFPLPTVTTSQCFIDFTSEPSANFVTGPTDSIAFSSSTVALVNGDSELRFQVSSLVNVDKTKITGVRFRIQATGNCTFRCLAVRAIAATWVYAPLDLNTLTHRIVKPVPLNGAATGTSAFPVATAPITPTDWPFLYRSSEPTGAADPRPIDLSTGVSFATGSLTTATGTNYSLISLHYRELSLDEYTQLDLDGGTFTQGRLDSLGAQPDFGRALFNSRPQGDLDSQTQSSLDTQTQFSLERVQDFLSEAFLEVKLRWVSGAAILTILDEDGNGYTFTDLVLQANTRYVLLVDLVENSIRATIFALTSQHSITGDPVYDTTAIIDGSFVHRRKGRFGWYAQLQDGDARIYNIRPRGATFAEYRSHPLLSDTPVSGAQIFPQASTDRNLVSILGPSLWGGTVSVDNTKSTPVPHDSTIDTGTAFKVVSTLPLQGVQTNSMYLDDFDQTYIEFDLWYPSDGLIAGAGLDAFLYGDLQRTAALYFPPIIPDTWQHIKIELKTLNNVITGPYSLVIGQTTGNVSVTWWLDNLVVNNRLIAWQGRGDPGDPWGMNTSEWLPFDGTANSDTGGLVFAERGDEMQVSGLARRQNAIISSVKVVPKYAELGRFVWSDQIVAPTRVTAPTINAVTNGRTVTFTQTGGSSSTIAYYWTFGDGVFDYGPSVSHTYAYAGTYTVTLVSITTTGARASSTATVAIT